MGVTQEEQDLKNLNWFIGNIKSIVLTINNSSIASPGLSNTITRTISILNKLPEINKHGVEIGNVLKILENLAAQSTKAYLLNTKDRIKFREIKFDIESRAKSDSAILITRTVNLLNSLKSNIGETNINKLIAFLMSQKKTKPALAKSDELILSEFKNIWSTNKATDKLIGIFNLLRGLKLTVIEHETIKINQFSNKQNQFIKSRQVYVPKFGLRTQKVIENNLREKVQFLDSKIFGKLKNTTEKLTSLRANVLKLTGQEHTQKESFFAGVFADAKSISGVMESCPKLLNLIFSTLGELEAKRLRPYLINLIEEEQDKFNKILKFYKLNYNVGTKKLPNF